MFTSKLLIPPFSFSFFSSIMIEIKCSWRYIHHSFLSPLISSPIDQRIDLKICCIRHEALIRKVAFNQYWEVWLMKFPISEKFRKTYYSGLKGARSLRTCTRSMNIMYFHLVLGYAYNRLKRDYIPIGRQAGSRARQTVWTEGLRTGSSMITYWIEQLFSGLPGFAAYIQSSRRSWYGVRTWTWSTYLLFV